MTQGMLAGHDYLYVLAFVLVAGAVVIISHIKERRENK
jgi:hypothetical protein